MVYSREQHPKFMQVHGVTMCCSALQVTPSFALHPHKTYDCRLNVTAAHPHSPKEQRQVCRHQPIRNGLGRVDPALFCQVAQSLRVHQCLGMIW